MCTWTALPWLLVPFLALAGADDAAPRAPDDAFHPADRQVGAPALRGPEGGQATTTPLERLAAKGDAAVQVFVRLDVPPVARLGPASPVERRERASRIDAAHDALIPWIERAGGQVIGRLRTVSSGVLVTMPARIAVEIAALSGVAGIAELHDLEPHVGETIPWIGADTVHDLGVTGLGVRVAVLDSGIDYTHTDLGGRGRPGDYPAATIGTNPGCVTGFEAVCAAALTPPGALFPTSRIAGGWDFVGEQWMGGTSPPLAPDPNPIDRTGHGTHVAAVLGGDGALTGVAPGVTFYALKVCSSRQPTCSIAAALLALDWAADPDGNPGTDDAVDIINMSIGRSYGMEEDPFVDAVDNAAGIGILTIASAGTSGDRTYSAASPCVAARAICVGGEHKPSALDYSTTAAGLPVPLHAQYWGAPLSTPIAGALRSGGNGCAVLDPATFAGSIALVERGTCTFAQKAQNAHTAGALGVIIRDNRAQSANELPVDDVGIGYTGSIPVFSTTTTGGSRLLDAAGDVLTIDPASAAPIVHHMLGSSSRGPSIQENRIKPDITAPGSAVSALVGSQTGASAISGTSMSAPHVAGAAALLLESNPSLRPEEVKVRLCGSARDGLVAGLPGATRPASVGWSGCGGLDVAAAMNASLQAWTEPVPASLSDRQPGLSFDYVTVSDAFAQADSVFLWNPDPDPLALSVQSVWNDPANEGSGVAVVPGVNDFVIGSGAFASVPVELQVNPSALPEWTADRGLGGYDGREFDRHEYDGKLVFETAGGAVRHVVPWLAVVKRVADVDGTVDPTPGPWFVGSLDLANASPVVEGPVEIFGLLDESADLFGYEVGRCTSAGFDPGCGESPVDLRHVGIRFRDDPGRGGGGTGPVVEVAVSLHDIPYRAAGLPVQIDVRFDTNLDGSYDRVLFNSPVEDGRNAVFTFDFATATSQFAGYLESDFDSGLYVLGAPTGQLGLVDGTPFDMLVLAWDIYFTGTLWDCSPFPPAGQPCGFSDHRMTVGGNRFPPLPGPSTSVPPGTVQSVPYGGDAASAATAPAHIGLLAVYPRAHPRHESQAFTLVRPEDGDGDGRNDEADCAPGNAGAFAAPGEVPTAAWSDTFGWIEINGASGAATAYRVHRESGGFGPVGAAPDGTSFGPLDALEFDEATVPPPGGLFRYLVRGENVCGDGVWGFASSGAPRVP